MTSLVTSPTLVGIEPRPYQDEGANFLRSRKRAMLTDAPGLGKTPQSVMASEPPVMVVAPNYLVGQWRDWVTEHTRGYVVVAVEGSRYEKMNAIVRGDADFLILSRETLRIHSKLLTGVASRYSTLILDESHHYRNRGTESAKAALIIAKIIPRVYLLTATPIWKDIDDLFMQFRILHPDLFTSYYVFVDKFCIADSTRFGTKVLGVKKEAVPELEELLQVMRLGRSYKDVGRQLPPMLPEPPADVLRLDFDAPMRRIYDEAVDNFRVEMAGPDGEDLILTNFAQVMHTLRQMTGWPGKVEALLECVDDLDRYVKGRTVVFTWYRDLAYTLAEALTKHGHPAVAITGDVSDTEERRRLARGDKIVVATIASLSEGVDLSWARCVIFAEEHWTPGAHTQALARIVRDRNSSSSVNEEPVLVHYLVVRNSIDAVVHAAARRRSATIREVLRETLGV